MPKPPKITKDRVPTAKPVRLQPPGLKMRYRPFGAKEIEGAVDGMDIDEDHVEEGSPERKKKRQKGTEDGEKKKKKKKNKEKNLA